MSETLSVTQRTIERDLAAMQKAGIIRHEGKVNAGAVSYTHLWAGEAGRRAGWQEAASGPPWRLWARRLSRRKAAWEFRQKRA